MKMVNYEVVKTTIDILKLVEMIINIVVRYFSLIELIINDCSFLFNLKFWFLLYYFFDIKHRLSTVFYT